MVIVFESEAWPVNVFQQQKKINKWIMDTKQCLWPLQRLWYRIWTCVYASWLRSKQLSWGERLKHVFPQNKTDSKAGERVCGCNATRGRKIWGLCCCLSVMSSGVLHRKEIFNLNTKCAWVSLSDADVDCLQPKTKTLYLKLLLFSMWLA